MDLAQLKYSHSSKRTLQRRAARTRRSRVLRRLVFTLTGMCLVLVLRLNPELQNEILAYAGIQEHSVSGVVAKPADVYVSVIPNSTVPVRRGGQLHTASVQSLQQNAKARASVPSQTLPAGG